MAKKTTRINETDRYDAFTARGRAMDDAPVGASATNSRPAEDAVLALNVAKMMAADILLDGAKTDHKAIAKHVEAKGVNLKAHAWADKIIKSGKAAEAVRLFEDTLKILKIRGRPVASSQLELLASESDLAPLDERASEAGRFAGIMGYDADTNPHAIDSVAGQAWLSAWYGGEAERKLILSMEPTVPEHIQSGEDPDSGDDHGDPFAETTE